MRRCTTRGCTAEAEPSCCCCDAHLGTDPLLHKHEEIAGRRIVVWRWVHVVTGRRVWCDVCPPGGGWESDKATHAWMEPLMLREHPRD